MLELLMVMGGEGKWASWGYNCGEDVHREKLKTEINDTDTELAVQEWRNLSSFLALTPHYTDNPA